MGLSVPPIHGEGEKAAAGSAWRRVLALHRRHPGRFLLGASVIFAATAILLTVAAGPRHDYVHYLEQWHHTLGGGDPWDQSLHGQNPGYGPLFNALAPFVHLHPLVPKLLFTMTWVLTAVTMARRFEAEPESGVLAPAVLAYFALTPYFWIEIPLYGHFDILPAAATLAAVHLTLRDRAGAGAGILALGALLKIVPLAALPFLIAARPARWRAMVRSFAGTCAVVLAISYALWGSSTFTAVLLPGRQESDLFSIFRFARGSYSPLQLVTDAPNLDMVSMPLVLLAGACLAVGLTRRANHPVVSIVTTFLVVFALFKLGHPQFQMVIFVLAPYLLLTLPPRVRGNTILLGALAAHVGWFSLLDLIYVAGKRLREPPWSELREVLGLPTFVLAVGVIVLLLRFRRQPVLVPGQADRPSP